MIQQFIGSFIVSSILLVGGSLVWPVVMKKERPAVLQAVRDTVVETEIGKQAEDVLGTYTDPKQISSMSSQVITQMQASVQHTVEDTVTTKVIEEVIKRFETLPIEKQEEMRAVICQPVQE